MPQGVNKTLVLRLLRRGKPRLYESSFAEQFARCLQDGVGGEAKFFLQIFERRRGPKGAHADEAPFRSCVVRPAESRTHFDRYPRGDSGRKHFIAITLVLMFEQVPGR